MSTTVQKKRYLAVITRDGDGFVGRCDELHANSQGGTFGEVVENMKEAMELAAEELGSASDFNMIIMEQ